VCSGPVPFFFASRAKRKWAVSWRRGWCFRLSMWWAWIVEAVAFIRCRVDGFRCFLRVVRKGSWRFRGGEAGAWDCRSGGVFHAVSSRLLSGAVVCSGPVPFFLRVVRKGSWRGCGSVIVAILAKRKRAVPDVMWSACGWGCAPGFFLRSVLAAKKGL